MGNIKNFNFNKLDFKLSNSDFWDFYLANDEGPLPDCNPLTSGDCFVVWYDFNNSDIFSNSGSTTDIFSLVTWTGATNSGYTFNTIGLTGIDNGLISFDKSSGDTSNLALLSALTGTTLVIPSGDTRLHLTRVTGTTGNYVYPYDIISDIAKPLVGNFANFYGGFYQGYYKLDGSTYEVLPTRVNQSWSAEFWLTTKQFSTPTGQTLNDVYSGNSGIFFYMGTRAENKFWDKWVGSDTGCTSGCTADSGCTDTVSEWCTVPKEDEINIIGDYGLEISLDPPRVDIDLITNGFLIYGRGSGQGVTYYTGESGSIIYTPSESASTATTYCYVCGGPHDGLGSKTACSYDGKGIAVPRVRQTTTNEQNPFLVYGRGSGYISSGDTSGCCTGPNDGLGNQSVYSFSGFTTDEETIDYNIDIIDNALGFRITPEGKIGYRLLTVTGTCIDEVYSSGVTIEEKYSEKSNLFDPNNWYNIVIKFTTDYKDECDMTTKPRKGVLKIYVNAKLVASFNEFDEFIAKRLDEYKSKQIGVPFNFSLGGGSQGLIESQTFGGMDMSDRGLPIEQNFGGTFMGGISQFKFNICDLPLCTIKNNYLAQAGRYL